MSEIAGPLPARPARRGFLGLVSDPVWQARLARVPLISRLVRREGEALFDLVAGFAYSQVLRALIETGVLERLRHGPQEAAALAAGTGVPAERMEILARAGTALGLLRTARGGRFRLTRRGAAAVGVPGLTEMIRHHALLYSDLADPVALLRGERETETARFWQYVEGRDDPDAAARYSELMAASQAMVAADTLDMVDLSGVRSLLDVGGGTGTFAAAAAARHPALRITVLDLPEVAAARRRGGLPAADRIDFVGGSFLDPLPAGHDAVSLIRVLYDHSDETVRHILAGAHDVLPEGGRLIVSEPMTGGDRPSRAGDVYFALYTMAMGTGRARSPDRIAELMREAGFTGIVRHRAVRPFVTTAISAQRA